MCTDPAGGAWCEAEYWGCPKNCKDTEKVCTIVNYDVNGEALSYVDKCIGVNATCPCGGNNTKCTIDGFSTCMPTSMAKDVCPCKSTEDTCYVQDFDTNAKAADEVRTVCVPKGGSCPCGKNTKACSGECMPKFGKEVKTCPMPCSPSEEAAGNVTCVKSHVNSKGEPTGEDVSCVLKGKCEPGRGQKKCPTGATISSAYSCKNIYAVASESTTDGARRLVQNKIATGKQQTATLTFTLKDVKSGTKDTAKVKVKLDSILQLQPELKTTLSMVASGTEASMRYKITNLGASKVTPLQVAEKLRGYLNSGKA